MSIPSAWCSSSCLVFRCESKLCSHRLLLSDVMQIQRRRSRQDPNRKSTGRCCTSLASQVDARFVMGVSLRACVQLLGRRDFSSELCSAHRSADGGWSIGRAKLAGHVFCTERAATARNVARSLSARTERRGSIGASSTSRGTTRRQEAALCRDGTAAARSDRAHGCCTPVVALFAGAARISTFAPEFTTRQPK